MVPASRSRITLIVGPFNITLEPEVMSARKFVPRSFEGAFLLGGQSAKARELCTALLLLGLLTRGPRRVFAARASDVAYTLGAYLTGF